MSKTSGPAVAIQQLLEKIYDVPSRCDISDFLITDSEIVAELQRNPAAREVSEKVLVSEDGIYLDLSLYLDADLLQRLRDENPLERLYEQNLPDFFLLVEGISHFLYLAWNGHHDKSVTLLELELQAEVDKFITALHLFSRQGSDHVSDEIHRCLFEYSRFDKNLTSEHLARYQHASRYAGKYCRTLYQRFMQRVRQPGLLAELRRFYRLPQSAKIRHIDTTFCAAV
ncbi:MAG: hypothetical protein KJO35_10460 [Gammaproteobacteria bacterium]|nr:hypothetical protein [Gammaproteobacteria bacterium]